MKHIVVIIVGIVLVVLAGVLLIAALCVPFEIFLLSYAVLGPLHCLNWFSKTSIIKWHEVPRSRWIGVVVMWVSSVGLYGYNYELGLYWLLFLSFLHVFLEFPLNWHSFFGIGRELMARARPT